MDTTFKTLHSDARPLAEFCRAHGFSRGMFYKLAPDQRPRIFRIGRKVMVSREAAAAWREKMEARASGE